MNDNPKWEIIQAHKHPVLFPLTLFFGKRECLTL